MTAPNASGATRAVCARLGDRLPTHLEGHRSRVTDPVSGLVHVWGDPPIVLRCGVPKPAGYSATSIQTTDVNGVLWFQQVSRTIVRWTTVRDGANIELAVPTSYDAQGGFLVEIGAAIQKTIP